MRNPRPLGLTVRTVSSILALFLAVSFGTGCDLFPGLEVDLDSDESSDDDDSASDDDDSSEPSASDDDDTVSLPDDDDTAEPADVCDGVDRDENFDCDSVPNNDTNGDLQDLVQVGPYDSTVAFNASTVDWTDSASQISVVGYGFDGDNDWSFLDINPELSDNGDWWIIDLEDGLYRITLRGPSEGQWADYDDYFRFGGEDENGDTVYDDARCLNPDPDDNGYAVSLRVANGVAEPGHCDTILEILAQLAN